MKKIYHFLVSMPFMGFLLLVLGFAMAMATFIETSWGTEAAKALIYNAHWFEFVFVLLGFSLIVNFISKKLYKREKLSVGIFHLSFILIVAGAAITRYVSFEGVIHIREGSSSNYIVSTDSYLTVKTGDQEIKKKVLFSELKSGRFNESITVNGQSIQIKSVGFVKNALRAPIEHASGSPLIDFVISEGDGMQSYSFSKGEQLVLGQTILGFNDESDVRFEQEGDSLYIVSDIDLEIRSMTGDDVEQISAGTRTKVKQMTLYAFDGYLILVKQFYPKALMRVVRDTSGNSPEDAVVLELSDGTRKNTINVFGREGQIGTPVNYNIGNMSVELAYGSDPIYLPFELYLKDFQLERYIGSDSPSSFASEITLIDTEENVERDIRVFMNNTLKYRGYRFYQSSYDQDELGTVLSVNKDYWGTLVTYIGYFLMALGMVLSLLNKNSYFQSLIRHLKEINKAKLTSLLVLTMFVGGQTFADDAAMAGIPSIDSELVDEFSELWVHGRDGRIEPMSTLSSEILRKVSRKSSFYGKSPDEVVLSMNLYPELWQTVPMVKVDKQVADKLGVVDTRVTVLDFFDESGQYRILEEVQAAYNKTPAVRTQYDKNFIYADERLNVCFMVYKGDYFTFFPAVNQDDAWHAAGSNPVGYPSADSLFVNRSFELLKESLSPGADVQPIQILTTIANFQEKFGGEILPTSFKKTAEISYNKIQPFKRIFPLYLALGFILLTILFVNVFRQKSISRILKRVFTVLIVAGFIFHGGGLALRWYISGHAPWSNGYESMVYVAWAAMLAGIVFGRKYPMVLGTAAFLSGLTLFVAHLNWMNPEITNLVPVLKSYWLLIHVAIITASYGFIGLSAFLGVLVLVLYAILKENNKRDVNHFIEQLTTISELSVTLGLYMLAIGTFLGGVWANESWGRYWGWDPKETWALITVLVYSFVVHMRLIPSLRGRFNFNLASVLGFTSVLMTYFGVNYYLSGMHSYGKGSVDGVHWAVYVCAGLVAGLIFIAYTKYQRFEGEEGHIK